MSIVKNESSGNWLLKNGKILKSGTTRDIRYYLPSSFDRSFTYQIKNKLSEFHILQDDFDDLFQEFPQNVYDILVYGFTEIFNNAIDHSQGSRIAVSTTFENNFLKLCIKDNGIGIFKKITNYFKLNNLRESILYLTKGKMTTDPSRHSGEGIFFTSRLFDTFEIYSNNLHFFRDNRENDWSFETISPKMIGSTIYMAIAKNSDRRLIKIFEKYQNPDSLAFDRTEILIELAKFGDEILISRSQAKRVLYGLEKFNHITLDFSRVRLIGQGFVDEIFRIFAKAHPNIVY